MKGRKDYSDYLQDILDSINDTDEFVKGMTFEDFLKPRFCSRLRSEAQ